MNIGSIGIVGSGVVGQLRARTVHRHPKLRLVGIADVNEAAARRAATASNVETFTDYRRLLGKPEVDAIIISTPGHLHEQIALDAFSAGKHVLCEKPLATAVDACRRMVDAAAAAQRTLAVGFNHRYYPCVKQLVRLIQSKVIGEIDHVRAHAGHSGLAEFRAEWMYKSEFSGGGAMMDIGIHMTDLVSYVAGDIVEITSATCSSDVWGVTGSEDNAIAIMKTRDGVPVRYQATWSEWKGYRFVLEVYGRRGMAGAYYAPMMNLMVTTDESRRRRRRIALHPWVSVREKIFGWQTTAEIAFAEELDEFVRLAAGERTRIADGKAGLRAVAAATAARRSSDTGKAVPILV